MPRQSLLTWMYSVLACPFADTSLIGRRRKVKCGEEKPTCNNCSVNSRSCVWPAQKDLVDRRWRTHARVSTQEATLPCFGDKVACENYANDCTNAGVARCHSLVGPRGQLEAVFINYFRDFLFPSCLLPGVATEFFTEVCWDYLNMAGRSEGVKDSIIACCASNRAILTKDARLARLGLKYYTGAIAYVNNKLANIAQRKEHPDACLLTAVVFLYLYEVRRAVLSSCIREY